MKKIIDFPQLSVIVPVYNESPNIELFYNRIKYILKENRFTYELIFVNDGSKDNTLEKLLLLQECDHCIKILDFSRNFGKEKALTAGLDYASGQAVIPIDADLQDPPELIPLLVQKWQEGYDVVNAKRSKREGEGILKKVTAHLFYRTMKKLTTVEIPEDTGDYRLLSRAVVETLKGMRENHRFMKGLFSWVGFRQTSIPFIRDPRFAGKSKFNFWKLWNFAVEGITSFSFLPLQIFTYFGFSVAAASIVYAAYLIGLTLLKGNPVPGYPSLMVAILFFGGVQLMTLGMIGEYVGRIYNESKKRPLYIIKRAYGFKPVKTKETGAM